MTTAKAGKYHFLKKIIFFINILLSKIILSTTNLVIFKQSLNDIRDEENLILVTKRATNRQSSNRDGIFLLSQLKTQYVFSKYLTTIQMLNDSIEWISSPIVNTLFWTNSAIPSNLSSSIHNSDASPSLNLGIKSALKR